MADPFDWNKVQVMTEAPSREAEVKQQRQQQEARSAMEWALNPLTALYPTPSESGIVPAAGIVGSILPAVFPEAAPFARLSQLLSKSSPVVRTTVPSLASSSALVAGAVPLEQLAAGKDVLSKETLRKEAGALVENAIFDIGGNLIFHVGDKAIKLTKDIYRQTTGKPLGFDPKAPEASARVAAQEFLDQYGATLTKSGLTGSEFQKGLEGVLETLPGSSLLTKRAENYERALKEGAVDIQKSLEVNPEFTGTLASNRGVVAMSVGDRFKKVHKIAEKELKESVAGVYKNLAEQGDGLFVDISKMQDEAKKELQALSRIKFGGSGEDKKKVLEEIIKQNPIIRFDDAHSLRSAWLTKARDLKDVAKPASSLEKEYVKAADSMSNLMDYIAVTTFGDVEQKALARQLGLKGGIDQPAGLRSGEFLSYNIDDLSKLNLPKTLGSRQNVPILRDYFNAQRAYKEGLETLYSDTVSAALKTEPSSVGAYLFNIENPERAQEAWRAISKMSQYTPKAAGLKEELKYGFLEEMFRSQEGITKFAKSFKEDKVFKANMKFLFNDPKTIKQLEVLSDAAVFGAPQNVGPTTLRTRALAAGTSLLAGGAAYFALPSEVKETAREYLGTGVVLYLTPRLLSRAVTDPKAMNALAGLAKAQNNPRTAGAVTLKSLEILRESGILGNQYMEDVNTMLYGEDYAKSKQTPSFQGWENVKVMER